jgi:FkbM family methyltransferase
LRFTLRAVSRSLSGIKTCQVGNVTIKVGVASELEHYRAETYATKEPETIDWLDENLRDEDVFMDVGANIGLYSLYAAKLRPHARIYAFEPAAQNFSRLCRNIVLNGMTNIIPCNFPLSDRETFDVFYVGDAQAGAALHSFGRLSDFRNVTDAVALRQGAFSLTLDALVGEYRLPQPALLKIDVDGIEEKILDGAEAVLESNQLRTILVEVTCREGVASAWPERKLGQFGYKLKRKSDWVAELNGLKSQNYIFSRT